jgi:hypothetical protein
MTVLDSSDKWTILRVCNHGVVLAVIMVRGLVAKIHVG